MSDVRYTSVADRAYRLLLRLYPREFRERFGGDMTDFFHDRRLAARQHGALGVARVWASAVADVARVSVLERADTTVRRLRALGDSRHHTTDHPPFDARDEDMMATFMADIRYALRGMVTKPAFSGVVLATLALGIGANVAIFSVVNGVLLRPLPYPNADRVVQIEHVEPYGLVSEGEFVDYRDGTKRFGRMAAFSQTSGTLTGEREPERLTIAQVSDGFFSILQVPAEVGRTFVPDDMGFRAAPRS